MARCTVDFLHRDLATAGTVEHAPKREILGEIFIVMRGARSDEQQITCLERVPLAIVNENALAANDGVNLILRVRRLSVRRLGQSELYVEAATLQDEYRALARGTRDTLLSLDKSDHTATGHRRQRFAVGCHNYERSTTG